MELLKFDAEKCSLCGACVEKCPFGALTIEGSGIVVSDKCRVCGLCVRHCPEKAIRFEQKAKAFDKNEWRDFLIAFGGNIMAQISITKSRPQFATVRYKVMDKAAKVENPTGEVVLCEFRLCSMQLRPKEKISKAYILLL